MVKLEKGNGDVLLTLDCDGEKQDILWEDLKKYWPSGERHMIANVGAFVQEPCVTCWLVYANGSKGVICVWHTKAKKIIHVSEGSYVRKALIAGTMVFSLRELAKPDINELVLCMSPGPNLDGESKPKVAMVPLNIKIFDKKFNIDNYKLGAKDDCIYAGFRNEVRKIKFKAEKTEKPADTEEKPTMPS